LLEGDVQIGFVDVPGHERFLHNALAGLGGIRVMMLVVAADEGIKPQTREHLAVCASLGIPEAVVAITKRDLVDPDTLELVQVEVAELLARTCYAGAVQVPVSSRTGEGLPQLRAELRAFADRGLADALEQRPVRLPVDRAFRLKGLGVVVTGTLASGVIRVGDCLELLPGGALQRVRSIQVHGEPPEQALPGERT